MTEARGARRTTPVELLWDLVFAFALTRVTTLLASDLAWAELGRAMLALALVWWAWSAYVWATNAQDPDAATFRGVMLLAIALIFIAGLALPRAFGSEATLVAVTYTLVRLLHLALYADAARRGNASLAAIAGFAGTVAVGMALLVAGSFADGGLRVALWAAAAVIDYAGPGGLGRRRLRGIQQVAVAHFAERYSLFVIICLGESIVAIGVGATGQPLSAQTVVVLTLALLVTIGMWWTYFDRFAAAAEERLVSHAEPVLAASDAYSYLHLLLVAGIIVFAAGARAAFMHPHTALPTGAQLALCAGVALYLAGQVAFRLRIAGTIAYAKAVAAAACVAAFALVGHRAPWVTIAALTVVLVALVAWETVAEDADDRAADPAGGADEGATSP